MDDKPLVTVVVPIYNVEKYLAKCIDSIIKQTYSNIEIILVNDGTKDNSFEIAKQKAMQDNRIKLISQENQGLSEARNTGIQNATGKYICFIDSDDYVQKDYIKKLLENAIKNNADISACDFWYIDETEKTWSRKEKQSQNYSNIEALKDIFCGEQNTEVMTWNKLYKLQLFTQNAILFPKGKLHEDNFTTYQLYYYANKISLISDKLYYYLQRSNSIMGTKFNVKRLDILQAVEETKQFASKHQLNMDSELEYYELMINVNILNTMIKNQFEGEEKSKIVNHISKNRNKYDKNKYLHKKEKIALFFIRGKGTLYTFIYKILSNKKA